MSKHKHYDIHDIIIET